MGGPTRRLLPAALTGGFVALAAYDVSYWFAAFRQAPLAQDTSIYYVAAKIGLERGWSHIYDLNLQSQFFASLHSGLVDSSLVPLCYANPPLLAWIMAPLTAFPAVAAFLMVVALSIVALMTAGSLVAVSGTQRILFIAGALAWYPVIYCLRLGQVSLLVGALVVIFWWLEQKGQPELAGAVLALTAIKPQLGLLVAPCLLLAGHRRIFVSWLLTTVAIGLVSILSLGASGVGQYLHVLGVVHAATYNDHFTLRALGLGSVATTVLQGFAASLTFGVAYRMRHEGTACVIAVALIGGMLAAPYLHVDDFALLVVAGWLMFREAHSVVQRLGLVPMAVTMELAWVLGPLPILASLTISLLLFLFRRAEPRSIALAA